MNNRHINASSFKKHCFVVLNVKLQVTAFALKPPLKRLALIEVCACLSNKRVIYGLELNL